MDKLRQPDTGEFVTYHSERTVGSQYSGTGQDFSFFSAKSEKVLQNALGRRVWVITSVGQKSPRYFLAGHYIRRGSPRWRCFICTRQRNAPAPVC